MTGGKSSRFGFWVEVSRVDRNANAKQRVLQRLKRLVAKAICFVEAWMCMENPVEEVKGDDGLAILLVRTSGGDFLP